MSKTSRIAGAVIGATVLAVSLAACGGDSLEKDKGGAAPASGSGSGAGSGKKIPLVIGAAAFTESKVLAELYAQVLGDAGYATSITTVNNRELYEPSLEKGEIDVVPEYAATITEFLNAKVNGANPKPLASSDAAATVAELKKLAEPRGLKVLSVGEAVDQNAFAVTKEFAEKNKITTLSDLGKSKIKVKIAAGDECEVRPFCAPGLKKVYGIDVTGIDPKGVGTPQAKQAVKDGVDQVVLSTTTDGTLDSFGLVVLEDDKKLQNADNVVPVVNAKDAGSPEIADILNKLTAALTTDDLAKLNLKVDAERAKPADVAKEYLESKGLVKK
ncbi:ABC transporter substrate-binding protein [Streptomyces sp. NPDC051569]|uniref:ABC transporter substrate-binding protein n=1 Tax=Streptomyces sp. NPDC051569 TaxID=3365661 RepID=UPI0037AC2B01